MNPEDHVTHGGNHGGNHEENQPSPPPLLPNATVTIYFDGLICSAYNKERRLYQGAVLTQAEGHHLLIEVRLRGEEELLWPVNETDWDPDHAAVNEKAPFWLYVDSGNGRNEDEFSAQLHRPKPANAQSFENIFNFEVRHRRMLPPKPGTFAVFNFPQGTCYSAQNTNAELKTLSKGQAVSAAVTLKDSFRVSTLTAIDIDAVSNGRAKKFIVLANETGEFFRYELKPDKHYEINICNEPIEQPQPAVHNHLEHFLQFYELFDLEKLGVDKMFIVAPPLPPGLHSPPCVPTSGDTKNGLG